MLKAIHAQENKKAACMNAKTVVADLKAMKLKEGARKVENGIEKNADLLRFFLRTLDAYP